METGEPTFEEQSWRFDKRVSIGHLVATLLVVSTFVIWLMSIDNRVKVAEKEIIDIYEHDLQHSLRAEEQFRRIEGRMETQSQRLEGRMGAQYNEIIRRLEILDARLARQNGNVGWPKDSTD